MTKKRIVLPLVAITVILCWMGSWILIDSPANLALAQNAAPGAERQTVLIDRKPSRRWVREDSYATFNFVTLDEDRGEVFFSNDGGAGASIEAYHADFPPEWSERIMEPLRKISGPQVRGGRRADSAIKIEGLAG